MLFWEQKMLTVCEFLIFQAKGQRYEYGDFVIKFGQVSAGPSFKGLVVEVWHPIFFVLIKWIQFITGMESEY